MKTETKTNFRGEEVTEITLNNGNKLTIKENENISTVRFFETNNSNRFENNGKVRAVTLESNNKSGLGVNVHTTMKKVESNVRRKHNNRGGEIIVEKKNWMEHCTSLTDNYFSNVVNIFFDK